MSSQKPNTDPARDRQKILYADDPFIRYAAEHSLRVHPTQQKLIDFTLSHPWCRMLGSPDEIQLLQNIVRCTGAKKTLDIGVYTGYSAMSIAMALPADGMVVACDISNEWPLLGKPFWEEAGVAQKINLVIGPADVTLKNLLDRGEAGTFDFAFIDADKNNYDSYYELCLKLLRPRGVIAIDNMCGAGRSSRRSSPTRTPWHCECSRGRFTPTTESTSAF
jgi:predicted O-methyltransferase YrrM